MTSYYRAFRYTLISMATRYGLAVIVQHLLDNGVPPDYLPERPLWVEEWPEGQSALHRAANSGYEKVCKLLIDAGANVHGICEDDCPLAAAGRSGNPAVVRLMLESGVDICRDLYSITETLLTNWWRYAEGSKDRKVILAMFQDAGVWWSTIALLAAFSSSLALSSRLLAEWLGDEVPIAHLSNMTFEVTALIQKAVDHTDNMTLEALQWLVNDSRGVAG